MVAFSDIRGSTVAVPRGLPSPGVHHPLSSSLVQCTHLPGHAPGPGSWPWCGRGPGILSSLGKAPVLLAVGSCDGPASVLSSAAMAIFLFLS